MREFSPFSVLVDLSDVAFLEMGESEKVDIADELLMVVEGTWAHACMGIVHLRRPRVYGHDPI